MTYRLDLVCAVCRRWNRGTHLLRGVGVPVCGRASCLLELARRHALGAVLVSDDPALD